MAGGRGEFSLPRSGESLNSVADDFVDDPSRSTTGRSDEPITDPSDAEAPSMHLSSSTLSSLPSPISSPVTGKPGRDSAHVRGATDALAVQMWMDATVEVDSQPVRRDVTTVRSILDSPRDRPLTPSAVSFLQDWLANREKLLINASVLKKIMQATSNDGIAQQLEELQTCSDPSFPL